MNPEAALITSQIDALETATCATPLAMKNRDRRLRLLRARLDELDPQRRDKKPAGRAFLTAAESRPRRVRFERLGVLRNDMREDPASAPFPWIRPIDPSPWGPEAQAELLEIARGQCRCHPGYICPGCQEALAENQAEGGGR